MKIKIKAMLESVPFKRVCQNGKRHFNAPKYTEFKKELGFFALRAMRNCEQLKGELRMKVEIYKESPRDVTSRQWGDADNHLKSVMDALNGICYEDDSQIIEAVVRKKSGVPRIEIELEELR